MLPPDIPAVASRQRARLPFENPLLAVFKKKGNDWDLLLVAHLPMRCTQADDPARCDEVVAFRSVLFRYDDRPQIALQIVHAGEPRLTESMTYRLDRGQLDTTFSSALPRSGVEVAFGPEGDRKRGRHVHQQGAAAALPQLHADEQHVFGERKFRILSESLEPEWNDRQDLELSYWSLVHSPRSRTTWYGSSSVLRRPPPILRNLSTRSSS